jgi:DNA-binding transcriptional LysR family regulator
MARWVALPKSALDGLGIAYVPEGVAEPFLREGRLVRVLESWSTPGQVLFLFYHGRRQVPTALRAFIDMVRAQKSVAGKR